MKKLKRNIILGAAITAAFAGGVAWAQGGITVSYNGKTLTSGGRIINGQLFIPARAVADNFDLQVVKRSDTRYELTKAGGTYQAGKGGNKLGDTVFTGGWRIRIDKAYFVDGDEYQFRYQKDYDPLPAEGKRLFAVEGYISNANQETTFNRMTRGQNGLADKDGISHQLEAVDVAGPSYEDGRTADMLPGARLPIVFLFRVSEDTRPKDIIIDMWSRLPGSPSSILRISLPETE